MNFFKFLMDDTSAIGGMIGFIILVAEGFGFKISKNKTMNLLISLFAVGLLAFSVGMYFKDTTDEKEEILVPVVSSSIPDGAGSESPANSETQKDSTTGKPESSGWEDSSSSSQGEGVFTKAELEDPVEIPDIVGMNVYEAMQLLTVAGLRVDSTNALDDAYVCGQSPEAGELVERGTTVVMKSSQEQVKMPQQTLNDYFMSAMKTNGASVKMDQEGELVFWSLYTTVVGKYNLNETGSQEDKNLNYLPKGLCFMKISFTGVIASDVQMAIYYLNSDGNESVRGIGFATENNATLMILPEGRYMIHAFGNGHQWKKEVTIERSDNIMLQMEQEY